MKILPTVLLALAVSSTVVLAEVVTTTQEQVKSEVQNRFKQMSTDELLEKRGTITSKQERNQLHDELMSRQKEMTKEQQEKFNKRPENRTPKRMNQNSGAGMGSGMGNGGGRGR
ncbi:hypothetical protein [Sulfurimonas sp.]|uniref:hypothetical protein n=1 Tax=Sulfurimonas sp. TaxID=2022749 RepID=UPI0025E269AE|nr:hypothetical protein [Sulfurimonas sp.]MDD5157378.1 hypothetical protein [Sulfurimonas sp.]